MNRSIGHIQIGEQRALVKEICSEGKLLDDDSKAMLHGTQDTEVQEIMIFAPIPN